MDKAEAEQKFAKARELLRQGQRSSNEALRLLRELSGHIVHARSRGQINERIWACERQSGKREKFFSQAGQDAFLDEKIFKGKRDGVFVEIGGYDGISGSNCLFFEMIRGWSGILIEPSPTFYKLAASFRKATCLQVALADEEGEAEFLEVQEGYSQMSGLTSSYDSGLLKQVEENPNHKGELIKVKTKTLPQILDQNFLKDIDYISLDVEGGEMSVLSAFPFAKYNVTAWTIENNTADKEVPALMKANGYRRVEALGVDDVYLKSES